MCRYAAIVLFACFITVTVHAQKLDSLKAVLLEYKLADTSRVELLIDMTRVYRDSNPDSMLAVSMRALELARRTSYRKGEAEALFQAGVAYSTQNKYDSGLAYYNRSLAVIQANGLQKLECQLLLDIIMVYSRINKIDDGLATAKRCIALSHKMGYWELEATAHLRSGDLYRDKTKYTEALDEYLSALKIYEAHRAVKGQGEAHRDMADIYSLVGNYPKALESIEKSNAMYTAGDDLQEVIVNYTSTGAVYGQMKDYDRSLAAYRKAASLADSIKNPFWRGLAFLNMGECFNGMEQVDSAEHCYRVALGEIQKSGDAMAAAYCNRGMGQVALKKGRTTEAIRYLSQAYDVMLQAKVTRELFEISKLLSQAYEQNKDYASALKYMHIHLEYRDTIFNEDNLKRIQDLQRDYELNRKEAEIKLLSKDKLIEQGNIARQRAVMWGLVSGVALLVVIIVLLVISRRAERQNKQKIIQQRDELAAQAVRLDELNNFKDKTFSVLSHDLRGPIASVSSAIGLLDNDLAKEELEMIKPEINRQLGAVSMLLENLLNWSRGHMQGGRAVNRQPTDLKQLVANNIAMAAPVAAGKQIKIENRIDTDVYALADKGQIDIVIRNLLNNAVKFTDKGGLVYVDARKTGNEVSLSVTDTGVGMTSEQIAKLFKPAEDKSTYGTSGEKGTGLGLLLCYEFITANEGRIEVTSEKGKGSTFTVTLPGL
jgi:signal transduction histidine kinase